MGPCCRRSEEGAQQVAPLPLNIIAIGFFFLLQHCFEENQYQCHFTNTAAQPRAYSPIAGRCCLSKTLQPRSLRSLQHRASGRAAIVLQQHALQR
jgi:hypothetical protein